jgi:hypothetical protein
MMTILEKGTEDNENGIIPAHLMVTITRGEKV